MNWEEEMVIKLNRHFRRLLVLMMSLALVFLFACGGGDSGGDDSSATDDGVGPGGGTTTPTTTPVTTTTIAFNVAGATALMAQEDTVAAAGSSMLNLFGNNTSDDGRELFTYQIVGKNASKNKSFFEKMGGLFFAETETSGSNLLSVDADGNASLAIDTNAFIKVMYTVTDPAGEYVYMALDTGWFSGGGDGNDYATFIAENNCALYKVKIADNSYSCVMEGILLQTMEGDYMKAVSGGQKPLQFDEDGNIYIVGTPFERREDCYDDGQGGQNCYYWLDWVTWNGQIFKIDTAGASSTITQDNTSVDFYTVLPTGEVVYQVRDTMTWQASLYLYQGTATIDLSTGGWGVDFFAVDTYKSVMFGGWSTKGLNFAKPRGVGVEKATMDTNLFGGGREDWQAATPTRIIVGDDGRIYGVFQSWFWDPVENTSSQKLSVYQVLPYDGTPKLSLTLDETAGWWAWMESTPFQIAKGYLYYTEEYDANDFLGLRDTIKIVKLSDRSTRQILADKRYEIYSWRLSGTTLYFSALDKEQTKVVTGKIDTTKVTPDADTSEYLTIQETASALGAASAVQDIEVLTPKQPETDTGGNPVVQQFHVASENVNSISLDFSKYMDKASVEERITVTDAASTEIDTLKVWVYKTLHLIPDQGGLADSSGTDPLSYGTTYTVALADGVMDAFNWDLDDSVFPKTASLTTRPLTGWYLTDTDADLAALTSGKSAKFARENDSWGVKAYGITGGLPDNFRIEFSAINYEWEGMKIYVFDMDRTQTFYEWFSWSNEAPLFLANLGQWSDVNYTTGTNSWGYEFDSTWGETNKLFAGKWQRYRIDVYGTNLVISYSNDGTTFEESESIGDLMLREAGASYTFYLGTQQAVGLDNIDVYALDTEGALVIQDTDSSTDTTGDAVAIFSLDFDDQESFAAVFDSTYEITDQDLIEVASDNEGTRMVGADVTIGTALTAQVGAAGISYYAFDLGCDWNLQGTYTITLSGTTSSLTMSHYTPTAVTDNLQSTGTEGATSLSINVTDTCQKQMIAVANSSASLATFTIGITATQGSRGNPFTLTVDTTGNAAAYTGTVAGDMAVYYTFNASAGDHFVKVDVTGDVQIYVEYYSSANDWWSWVDSQSCWQFTDEAGMCYTGELEAGLDYRFRLDNQKVTTDATYSVKVLPATLYAGDGSSGTPEVLTVNTAFAGSVPGDGTSYYKFTTDGTGGSYTFTLVSAGGRTGDLYASVDLYRNSDFSNSESLNWPAYDTTRAYTSTYSLAANTPYYLKVSYSDTYNPTPYLYTLTVTKN